MNNLSIKHYKIPNLNKYWLDKNNFKYCANISSEEDGHFYRHNFPCYKYLDYVCLVCEITVNIDTNDAIVDVLDSGRARYAPFYFIEYGDYTPLLDEISESISKRLDRIGLVEKNNDNNSRRQMFDLPVRNNKRRKQGERKDNMQCQK